MISTFCQENMGAVNDWKALSSELDNAAVLDAFRKAERRTIEHRNYEAALY